MENFRDETFNANVLGRCHAMRYFFDYRSKDKSLYDYEGDEFVTSQAAIEFAEATVQVLKHSLAGTWLGWTIEVRDAEGKKFCSLDVGTTSMTSPHSIPF
jgi:hypothetical protein